MEVEFIIGKKIKEIYETKPSSGESFFGYGKASYFKIVVALEDGNKFELGPHNILPCNSTERLFRSEGTVWASQNNLEYKNQTIVSVIKRDAEEYYDGSLTLVLENNIILQHQCCNGDQLFIDKVSNIPD